MDNEPTRESVGETYLNVPRHCRRPKRRGNRTATLPRGRRRTSLSRSSWRCFCYCWPLRPSCSRTSFWSSKWYLQKNNGACIRDGTMNECRRIASLAGATSMQAREFLRVQIIFSAQERDSSFEHLECPLRIWAINRIELQESIAS